MDLFKNKNFWAINCINQDLNSATNVKLAVIAEVTQGSKPVLGAKVCHQTWFNLVPNQSSKWCPKMKVGLPLPHYSKVVAEVERPQGAPISLILKVEPCRWQIHTIFSLLAISLILQNWHIWFWKQYFEPQVISFGVGISLLLLKKEISDNFQDDGSSADKIKNDGIYSRYFTKFVAKLKFI